MYFVPTFLFSKISHFSFRFVKNYSAPLCCDSFSRFQSKDPKASENNSQVVEAFLYFLNTVLPNCAEELDKMDERRFEYFDLPHFLHSRGVNLRHLGMLYLQLTTERAKNTILLEILFRTAKNSLRYLWRSSLEHIRLSTIEPYIRSLIDYLNVLFLFTKIYSGSHPNDTFIIQQKLLSGNTEQSHEYWQIEFADTLYDCFFYHIKEEVLGYSSVPRLKRNDPFFSNLKENADLTKLLNKLFTHLGIQISASFQNKMEASLFKLELPFSERDIISIEPMAKTTALLQISKVALQAKDAMYVRTDYNLFSIIF